MKKKFLLSFILICIVVFAFGILCAYAGTEGYLSYSVSKGEVTITECDVLATEIVIPEIIEGFPVTNIGDDAFYNCRSLKSITIPNSMKCIGESAFYNCSSLSKITMPYGLTSIGYSAFYKCENLEIVNLSDIVSWCNIKFHDYLSNPLYYADILCINGESIEHIVIPGDVVNISDYAFYGCSSLKSIAISEGTTSIGKQTFAYCDNVLSVIIPESVIYIGEGAFKVCTNLSGVTIPQNVKQINNETFYGCYYLTDVNIPKGITRIGDDVFRNCASLTNIIIPDTVTSIGNRAFYYCPNLISITIPNSITKICDYVFYKCSSLGKISFKGTEEDWNDILISMGNEDLYNAEIIYILDGGKKEVCITTVTGENIFAFIPVYLSKDSTVILVCYNGEKMVEIQHTLNNETIHFVLNKVFDRAKVIVWESIDSLKPVCACEFIE